MTERLLFFYFLLVLLTLAAGAVEGGPAPMPVTSTPTKEKALARIDFYDAKTGRVYLVVYYEQMTHEGGGAVRFVKPHAIFIPREGTSLDDMLRDPVAQVMGETGRYDPARQVFHVREAQTVFKAAVASGGERETKATGSPVPVEITSKRLDAFPGEARAVYEEEVRLVRGETHVVCDVLHVFWDANTREILSARAMGRPVVARREARGKEESFEAFLVEVEFPSGRMVLPEGSKGRVSFLAPGLFRSETGSVQ